MVGRRKQDAVAPTMDCAGQCFVHYRLFVIVLILQDQEERDARSGLSGQRQKRQESVRREHDAREGGSRWRDVRINALAHRPYILHGQQAAEASSRVIPSPISFVCRENCATGHTNTSSRLARLESILRAGQKPSGRLSFDHSSRSIAAYAKKHSLTCWPRVCFASHAFGHAASMVNLKVPSAKVPGS